MRSHNLQPAHHRPPSFPFSFSCFCFCSSLRFSLAAEHISNKVLLIVELAAIENSGCWGSGSPCAVPCSALFEHLFCCVDYSAFCLKNPKLKEFCRNWGFVESYRLLATVSFCKIKCHSTDIFNSSAADRLSF